MAEAAAAVAPAAAAGGGEEGEAEGGGRGTAMRFLFQGFMIWTVMHFVSRGKKEAAQVASPVEEMVPGVPVQGRGGLQMRNLYGAMEECELFVHLSPWNWSSGLPISASGDRDPRTGLPTGRPGFQPISLSLAAVRNETLANEQGIELLWHKRVWYEANAPPESINISIPPLSAETLAGGPGPHILATLLRVSDDGDTPDDMVSRQMLPLVTKFRELNLNSDSGNLFGDDDGMPKPKKNLTGPKVSYMKTKLEFRPVHDQTVHTMASIQQGPFKKLRGFPEQGFYQTYLYISDFWMLEKDYMPLNGTLEGQRLNLSLSYNVVTSMSWSLQAQMAEQWSAQGEWGITDTQRDSFMLKRLMIDTNPYLLAFSGAFLLMHTLFSLLAFKNDIQFWRKNESMQGLSARSMVVGSVCQVITTLYLLDSQETSRLILFNICLDTALSTWKLRKAVKVSVDMSFPFVHFEGKEGYDKAGTSKYDDQAIRYMLAIITPLFIGYTIRSAVYGKHRGWYSFMVGSLAGGVYTFGFIMMTPQLYINYKLQSVEHLPWRALTYKAMNTFVDDIAALLIDMPMMHRLSCFRDDIIFFVYLYQRWVYTVDKKRPSMWVRPEETEAVADGAEPAAVADGSGDSGVPSSEATGAAATVASEPAVATGEEGGEAATSQSPGGKNGKARKRK